MDPRGRQHSHIASTPQGEPIHLAALSKGALDQELETHLIRIICFVTIKLEYGIGFPLSSASERGTGSQTYS